MGSADACSRPEPTEATTHAVGTIELLPCKTAACGGCASYHATLTFTWHEAVCRPRDRAAIRARAFAGRRRHGSGVGGAPPSHRRARGAEVPQRGGSAPAR